MECHYVMIATRAGEAAGKRRKLSLSAKIQIALQSAKQFDREGEEVKTRKVYY